MEKKIHLCSVEPTDIDTLFAWENDRDLWEAGDTILPLSRENLAFLVLCNMESNLRKEKQARFMIKCGELKEVKSLESVGMLDIFDYQAVHRRVTCGIFIAKEFRGKGYGERALRLLIEHGRRHLGLHQIYCEVMKGNEGSLKLFKKVGFSECGEKKDWVWREGGFSNVVCLQVIL